MHIENLSFDIRYIFFEVRFWGLLGEKERKFLNLVYECILRSVAHRHRWRCQLPQQKRACRVVVLFWKKGRKIRLNLERTERERSQKTQFTNSGKNFSGRKGTNVLTAQCNIFLISRYVHRYILLKELPKHTYIYRK